MSAALSQPTLAVPSSPSFCDGRKISEVEQAVLWTLLQPDPQCNQPRLAGLRVHLWHQRFAPNKIPQGRRWLTGAKAHGIISFIVCALSQLVVVRPYPLGVLLDRSAAALSMVRRGASDVLDRMMPPSGVLTGFRREAYNAPSAMPSWMLRGFDVTGGKKDERRISHS